MTYPHITQFETLERRARLSASVFAGAEPRRRALRTVRGVRRPRRKRVATQPC